MCDEWGLACVGLSGGHDVTDLFMIFYFILLYVTLLYSTLLDRATD